MSRSRHGSRWIDDQGRNTAMDLLMRSTHTGLVGNPLTKTALDSAIVAEEVPTSKLPACASDDYRVLGRSDPFDLAADDEAAFEKLGSILTTVDPIDHGSETTSRSDSRSKTPSPQPHSRPSSATARPLSASRGRPASPQPRPSSAAGSRAGGGGRGDAAGGSSSSVYFDQFPHSEEEEQQQHGADPTPAEIRAALRKSSPQRPQTRKHREGGTSPPSGDKVARRLHKQADFAAIYAQVPTSSYAPGGVPILPASTYASPHGSASLLHASSRGAGAGGGRGAGGGSRGVDMGIRTLRDPNTIRSPDALIDFGSRFNSLGTRANGLSGTLRPPRASRSRAGSRAGSRGSLGRTISTSSLASASSFASSSSLGDAGARQQNAMSRPGSRMKRVGSAPAIKEPKAPIVPLIAPVPAPLFSSGPGGRSEYGYLHPRNVGLGPGGPSMRYSQSTLRFLIAEMMLGLKDNVYTGSASTLGRGGDSAASLSRGGGSSASLF